MRRRFGAILALSLLIASSGASSLLGQDVVLTQETYVQPPKAIADVVTAPRHLNTTLRDLAPDGEHFLVARAAGLPTLEMFAKPFVNLGEIEFDHQANRLRRFTIDRSTAIEIWNHKAGARIDIKGPEGSWVSAAGRSGSRFRRGGGTSARAWSPDGSLIAYLVHDDREAHLHVADVASGQSRRLSATPLLATHVAYPIWTPDSKSLLTVLIPDSRSPRPEEGEVAGEPQVRISDDGSTPTRTYRFLMETPHDLAMLEWLSVGQIALIDVQGGGMKKLGSPDMIKDLDISPDGMHLLVEIMRKPFSYHVPVSSFGSDQLIWDMDARELAVVQKQELQKSTVRTGPQDPGDFGGGGVRNPDDKRNIAWLPDGSGLGYQQREASQRGRRGAGDDDSAPEEEEGARGRSTRKDRIIHWMPPFDEASQKVVYESENRIGDVDYSQDAKTIFVTETEDGEQHLFALKSDDMSTKHTLAKYRSNNIYRNPGSLMTRPGDRGGEVVRMSSDGSSVYLSGTQYSRKPLEEAPRPFVHKIEIGSGQKTTLFESGADVYEDVVNALDDDLSLLFTTRESRTMVEDTYARDLASGSFKRLTSNRDFSPEITQAKRMRFQVERVDGIKFWVDLTLPSDYAEGTRLPAMFWFYPREYTDQRSYDRSAGRYNKNGFPSVGTRSMAILTQAGYAVVEPDCPIIGRQGQMNNNYVPDLRNNLWAVIDALDKKGYIDRDRMGIGGHSYGAFGTANAMIHTPFFKAGIAGDGNYNRTLTPVSFQSERRFIWDAREVYIQMSPMLWADQLSGALLMYHGMDDANNGTFPINSDRMFHALNSLGKKTALYNYPYEHHGPATRETLLDLWARWVGWLEIHVKNHGQQPEKTAEEAVETPNSGRQ